MKIRKIISGGQTGADLAGLDFAIRCGIEHGGWIPKGRITEEGPLPAKYKLKETPSGKYSDRTEKNVIHSDGTLIFYESNLSGGSLLTHELCKKHHKAVLAIDLSTRKPTPAEAKTWIKDNQIKVLNVAGSRASVAPQIYDNVYSYLNEIFLDDHEKLVKLLQEYIRLFNGENFFKGHETLENYWRKSKGELKNYLHGLIQIAVSLHHAKNHNRIGAMKEYKLAKTKLSQFKTIFLGIYVGELLRDTSQFYENFNKGVVVGCPKIKTEVLGYESCSDY